MHLARLQRPFHRAAASSYRPFSAVLLEERFPHLRIASPTATNAAVLGCRYASVKSQGAYKLKSKKTIPKKMGAKKAGDQYVIPGNIIYKQRGTIWHPGENTIMGRNHTIHAAVSGYVKYYRDPQRHPKRQYIGVVFNREDRLPYPPGTPRRRKLNLAVVHRKIEEPVQELTSPSGIPISVTRHDTVAQTENDAVAAAAIVGEENNVPEEPVPLTDGNAVVSSLIKEKLRSRQAEHARKEARMLQQQKELDVRKGTRVYRLQDNYSYRETNWEIGRLVGDVGSVPGSEKTESRRAKFRLRRRKRMVYFRGIRKRMMAKAANRKHYKKIMHEKRKQDAVAAAKASKAAAAAAAAAEAAIAKQSKIKA